MTTMATTDAVREALDARLPDHRAALERLVRIPSVSAPGFDPAQVRRSAEATRELLASAGLDRARLLEVPGSHPAVYGEWLDAGADAPTVLCYAHHDVQPAGEAAAWSSPPFEPTERDGRLFARGAADDKAGVLVHVAAVDAWLRAGGALPVNVKVIVEGEEETGSAHLGDLLERYGDLLRADVIVLTDTVNWKVGVPAITYLLRGLVDAEVRVRALDHALHSGMYGGPVPDAVTGLVKMLAGLTDDAGTVAIPGFADDARRPSDDERARLRSLDVDEATFRADAGMLDGVAFVGDPDASVLERLWLRPAVTVIGLDVPSVAGSSNTLTPAAGARVSVRLAPGQDPQRARDLLCRWLRDRAPWGLHVEVTPGAAAGAFEAHPHGQHRDVFAAAERALEAAYGSPPVYAGVGGTIPFIGPFSRAFGGAPALLLGVEDPDTRAHGIDESLHLGDWRAACLGEAYLFAELAGDGRGQTPRDAP